MSQGIASSTHQTYKSSQRHFLNFCTQSGHLHPSCFPCPASEWTLCLFATHLSCSLSSASIKIYLSAVRSMHIDLGFPDQLADCLQLQRVLRGIKRTQGSPSFSPTHHRPSYDDNLQLALFCNPRSCYVLGCFHPCIIWISVFC